MGDVAEQGTSARPYHNVPVEPAAAAARAPAAAAACAEAADDQGLTLVHFSAQLERFVWDRGCAEGLCNPCSGGVRGSLGCFRVCRVFLCVRNGSS